MIDEILLNELQRKYPIIENDNRFKGHYVSWRKNRIKKLIQIMGRDWFIGKFILELGCGLGYVGIELKSLGAKVSFAEGQEAYIPQLVKNIRDSDVYLLDQDKEWNLNKRFDLIIHWGVSYHLDNWKQDLKSTMNHTNILSFETEVLDSDDITKEIKIKEDGWPEGAVNRVGTRVSVASIENFFDELGLEYVRYDDWSLNSKSDYGWSYVYDWKKGACESEFEDQFYDGLRRFWMVYRNEV